MTMVEWHEESGKGGGGHHDLGYEANAKLKICRNCGWWVIKETIWPLNLHGSREAIITKGTYGILARFDASDKSAPIDDIRAYLAAKYDARFAIEPHRFEDVVASVFRDIGYRVRVTGRHFADSGIDVILDGPDRSTVGVQVKRTRNSIKVEQLRSLVGALVLRGLTQGVFVTTSTFQSGAKPLADVAHIRGVRVELFDATRFYDALGMAQLAISRPKMWPVRHEALIDLDREVLSCDCPHCQIRSNR